MIFDDLPIIDVLELTSDCYKSIIAAGVFISDLTVTDIKRQYNKSAVDAFY